MTDNELSALLHWAAEENVATPVRLFSSRGMVTAARRLRARLDARISYSTKANPHPLALAALREEVDEFNVTNLVHLRDLLDAGVEPRRIAFINPVFSADTARDVLEAGVDRFVVDDPRGLGILALLGADAGITLRLRPTADGQAGRSVVRFGNTHEALLDLAPRAIQAGMHIDAVSVFIGTHSEDLGTAGPYRRALAEVTDLHGKLAAAGIDVPTVNIGGGFPGAQRAFHQAHPGFFDRLADQLAELVPAGVGVLCEPGRYVAEPAMAMLARVVADRTVDGRRMTYLDTSAFTGLFETTFIDAGGAGLPVVTGRTGEQTRTRLLGPVMDSFDVVKRSAELPRLMEGDMLLFPNTGAYSWGYGARVEGLGTCPVVELPAELDELVSQVWIG